MEAGLESVEKLEELVKGAVRAAAVVKTFPGTVRVVSHYDADGIASAAILVRALERDGKEFQLSFVNQLGEEYIEGLAREEEVLVVFADLGSGFLGEIGRHLFNMERKVIILDHHQVQGEVGKEYEDSVYHVNPLLFGIEGDISGSGVSYLMARALSPLNKDLSELAIVGAIGDSQIGSIGPHWGVLGINKEVLKDAQSSGKIELGKGLRLWGRYGRPVHKALQFSIDPYIPEVSGSESGSVQFLKELGIDLKEPTGEWRTLASLSEAETKKLATGIIKERIRNGEDNPEWIFGDVYELLDKKGNFRDANEFATMLNASGKSGNAFMGVGLCLNDDGFGQDLRKVMTEYRRDIGKAVELVRKNRGMVKVTEKADYILAGDRISEHIISNVASIIEKSCLVPDGVCHKPLFALADTDDGQIKVSGRVNDSLVKNGFSMKDILADVGRQLGGQGGGHLGAGGAVIPAGSEEMFINTVEKLLSAPSQERIVKGDGFEGNNLKERVQNIEKAQEGEVSDVAQQRLRNKQEGEGVLDVSERNGFGREKQYQQAGAGYGKAETEGSGAEGEEEGREKGDQGRAKPKARGSDRSQEVERQGLVRYLFS